MSKKVGGERLIIHGHLSTREVYEYRQEGWRLEWRDRPVKAQVNRNGIPKGLKGAV
ncbi:hypothetical protein [Sporosarcina sp. Marseille-Q4943]|uniref:hypothetical protein n=1 Tax=Sporosarcina sp. Marseille-Q4943 TaxID=2942204 RepID=UPI00208DD53E|nr:hypothetical protein [Sporosarcina sp. Marseille-Q4943]